MVGIGLETETERIVGVLGIATVMNLVIESATAIATLSDFAAEIGSDAV